MAGTASTPWLTWWVRGGSAANSTRIVTRATTGGWLSSPWGRGGTTTTT